MKNDIENENDNTQNNLLIKNDQFCPYCYINIPSDFYQDHIICHQIEQEDNKNNKIENNNNKININKEEQKEEENIPNKIFGFFGNIGNKAKEILNIENKTEINDINANQNKRESPNKITSFFSNIRDTISQKFESKKDEPSKISSFFNNIQNKISETFTKFKEKFNDSEDDSDEEEKKEKENREKTRRRIRELDALLRRNRLRNRINSDYRNDDNIDDLLLRFEEEDAINNNKKENLFKEDDAKEILRYIPNSIIQEEKNKNENNYKCLICLYEFKIGDKVCTLPCLHIFHIDCLKNWIIRNTWCPICKSDCSLDSLLKNNIVDNNA